MAGLPGKSADDLKYILALMVGLSPDRVRGGAIGLYPMADSWQAMSATYDDDPDLRSRVIKASIELAKQYDLDIVSILLLSRHIEKPRFPGAF